MRPQGLVRVMAGKSTGMCGAAAVGAWDASMAAALIAELMRMVIAGSERARGSGDAGATEPLAVANLVAAAMR